LPSASLHPRFVEGVRLDRIDLEQADRFPAADERDGQPRSEVSGGRRVADDAAFSLDVAEQRRLLLVEDPPAPADPATQALAQRARGERPDGGSDDQLVALHQGDRSARERQHRLQPVQGGLEDLVEIRLACRGNGDLDDELGGRGDGARWA